MKQLLLLFLLKNILVYKSCKIFQQTIISASKIEYYKSRCWMLVTMTTRIKVRYKIKNNEIYFLCFVVLLFVVHEYDYLKQSSFTLTILFYNLCVYIIGYNFTNLFVLPVNYNSMRTFVFASKIHDIRCGLRSLVCL